MFGHGGRDCVESAPVVVVVVSSVIVEPAGTLFACTVIAPRYPSPSGNANVPPGGDNATVALWVYNFVTFEEKEHAETDANGVFRFTDNPSHRIQLSAEKPGVGRSPRIPVLLYFRAQDTTLDSPLRLAGAG